MLIQYASDLHLEFVENDYVLRNAPIQPLADVLILAGDIVPFTSMKQFDWFFDDLASKFMMVYWVPGNHEYYHYDLANKRGAICEAVRPNIFLVNDYATVVDDMHLIFSTLWTHIEPQHQIAIERGMNDFHLIRKNGQLLTCEDLNEEHEVSRAFIEHELFQNTPDLKKLVVTHHVPTLINYPEKYLDSTLNKAFAVNLTRLIEGIGPDYWLFGHHHQNMPDFQIGNTTLITNQMGYVRFGEDKLFDSSKVLDTNRRQTQQFISR